MAIFLAKSDNSAQSYLKGPNQSINQKFVSFLSLGSMFWISNLQSSFISAWFFHTKCAPKDPQFQPSLAFRVHLHPWHSGPRHAYEGSVLTKLTSSTLSILNQGDGVKSSRIRQQINHYDYLTRWLHLLRHIPWSPAVRDVVLSELPARDIFSFFS